MNEAEAANKTSLPPEQTYQQIFERSNFVMLLVDPASGAIVRANSAACRFYGYSAARFETLNIKEINCLDQSQVETEMHRAANHECSRFLFSHRLASGEVREVEVSSSPFKLGERDLLCSIVYDITERNQNAEALKNNFALLASTLESTADGILVVDANRKIVAHNQKFLELWRIPAAIIEARDDNRLVEFVKAQLNNPLDFVETIERVYANPTEPCFSRLELADGRIYERYCQALKAPASGRVWSFRDVTARERAQIDLRSNAELFRTLIENAEDLITIFDSDWTIRYESPAVERILGFKPGELRKRHLLEIVHPADRRDTLKAMRYKIEHPGEIVEIHTRVRHKNGTYRMLHGSSVNLLDNPAVRGIVSNTRDVTESEQTAHALRLSEERYRTIFDKDVAANSISTPDARLLDCNESFWRTFGFESKEAALRVDLNRLFRSKAEREEIVETIRRHRTVKALEIHMRRIDNTTVNMVTNAVGIFDETGEMIEMHGHGFDITEQKRAETALRESEERLRQSQKLEAVGQLAGGIAHDFNNLLTAILGYSELLLDRVRDDRGAREKVEQIKKAGERAASLTTQLLAFSRKQMLQPTLLNLNRVVGDTVDLLQRLIGEHISIKLEFDPRLAAVTADRGQIEQVIVNLAVNARDAMPDGGTLRLKTENVRFGETDQRDRFVPIGEYAALIVSDTGVGMTEEVRARAFEPFFTTKETGKGTGLGLSTVYGIVKQSGGYISVASQPGHGTTFKIYLPPIAGECPTVAEERFALAQPRGTETVLLAEDELALREMMREVLESGGYRVLTAANGDEALRLAAAHDSAIDLLITDLVMPGIGGRQLAEQLLAERPNLKTVYISGYSEQTISQKHAFDQDFAFLPKPFALDDLTKIVREALEQK